MQYKNTAVQENTCVYYIVFSWLKWDISMTSNLKYR